MSISLNLAKIILYVTHEYFMVATIAFGYLCISRQAFARSLVILLFTIVFNGYLKSIWQIPLPSHLGIKGWAFPSGHMQTALVFWGWLALEFRSKIFSWLIAILLFLIAISLIREGYHNLTDIIGAIIFGSISLIIYRVIIKKLPEKYHPYIGIMFAIISLVIINSLSHKAKEYLNFTWRMVSVAALLGFSIGWILNHGSVTANSRLLKLIICVIGIVALYFVTSYFKPYIPTYTLALSKYFLLGLWVSYGVDYIVTRLKRYL
jgi:hypothetical protein